MKRIKVLHLGYSDYEGGAARAAARIHNSMLQQKNSIPIDQDPGIIFTIVSGIKMKANYINKMKYWNEMELLSDTKK